MSRIISEQYKTKINTIIEEYSITPNLLSTIEFFLTEVQKDQNSRCNRNQKVFSAADIERLGEIKESIKLKSLFSYLNLIIKEFPQQYLHIHINEDLSDCIIHNLTALFAWEVFVSSDYNKDSLKDEQKRLDSEINRDLILTGIGGHEQNKLRRERKGWRHQLRLIRHIMDFESPNTKNGVLLNLNLSVSNYVDLSEYSKFPEALNTYVNFGDNLRNIFKKMGKEKVLRLSKIFNLFPSITGKSIWYKDFTRDNVYRYKNFKKVIIITEGEKTPEALLEMQRLNRFQADEIYTIFSFEF